MSYSKIFIFIVCLVFLSCFPRPHQENLKVSDNVKDMSLSQPEKSSEEKDTSAIGSMIEKKDIPSKTETPVKSSENIPKESDIILMPDPPVKNPIPQTPSVSGMDIPLETPPKEQDTKQPVENPIPQTPSVSGMDIPLETPPEEQNTKQPVENPIPQTPTSLTDISSVPVKENLNSETIQKEPVIEKESSLSQEKTDSSPSLEKGTTKLKQRQEILELLPLIQKEVEQERILGKKIFVSGKRPGKAKKSSDLSKSGNIPLENALFISLQEKDKRQADYPVQIARPFIKGEISDYPQVYLDGSPVLTQADVKCRWEDGSVKHAILSFIVPVIKDSRTKITFRNQKTGNNDGFETKESMLIHYNFDACIHFKSDIESQKISAREMLKEGYFTYWQKGSVCTSVILADHSAKRIYDVGSDANKSFRPIFHATFWPGLKKFRIRFIGEISNTTVLQDQLYDLELTLGYRNSKTVYKKEIVQHHAMSRWTKNFWSGETLPNMEIYHNLQYLVATQFLPNYDYTKKIADRIIQECYTSWAGSEKNIFGAGNWAKYMPMTGGRWDIGAYPDWIIFWLYTGDHRMFEMSTGHADLAAAWPMHLREGKTDRFLDEAKKYNALGKVISLQARPSIFIPRYDYPYTSAEDKITPIAPFKEHGWIPDLAHQPDPYSILYMLTGDFWYLEQMYFWASWSAAAFDNSPDVWYGRGPKGCGSIQGEIRTEAWIFRSRVRTALLAPDGSEEKVYFTKLVEDVISIWEGQRDIKGTSYENTPAWKWGNTTGKGMWGGLDVPALHFWQRGDAHHAHEDSMDSSATLEAIAPWQMNFMMFSLGHAKELGYKTEALANWFAEFIINATLELGVEKMSLYRMPTVKKKDKKFFPNYTEIKEAYSSAFNFKEFFDSNLRDPVHGYTYIFVPSMSMAKDTGIEGGKDAWDAVKKQILISPVLDYYPKWLILPRTGD